MRASEGVGPLAILSDQQGGLRKFYPLKGVQGSFLVSGRQFGNGCVPCLIAKGVPPTFQRRRVERRFPQCDMRSHCRTSLLDSERLTRQEWPSSSICR